MADDDQLTPLHIKVTVGEMKRIDAYLASLAVPPSRTALVRAAIAQFLDIEEGGKKKGGRK